MKNIWLILLLLFFSCEKEYDAIIPELKWELFESASPLTSTSITAFEGVYTITDGSDLFGHQAAVKSSRLILNGDTTYHVSIFLENDITYFICEGRFIDSTVLLNGYWRNMTSVETGSVRFTINYASGARQLLSSSPIIAMDSILLEGVYGNGDAIPENKITLRFNRPLNQTGNFQILAHRAGGRTSDHLSISENTVEMINKSQQFGATGVEIDIRLTSDGVPILYHDNDVNARLIIPNGMTGPIENYSYTQLNNLARLVNGERIPKLREALDAVVYNTTLQYVWLDTKIDGDLTQLQQIQSEYLQKASSVGRTVEILIGLPEEDQLNNFLALQNYSNTPSLCELSRDDVRSANSKVWAPKWNLGTQNSEVDGVHAEGRKAFVWTMDVPDYVRQFTNDGHFDGILSNYPSIVAYYQYVK